MRVLDRVPAPSVLAVAMAIHAALLLGAGAAAQDDGLQMPADWCRRVTFHHEVTAYFDRVAAASPRVRVRRYGRSVEGRELVMAVVTAPRNHERIDAIIKATGDLRRSMPATAVPADLPATVWLAYGVHGDELSPTESALKMVHWLATSKDLSVTEVLERVVVIIDPLLNPDGRDRFAAYYRSAVSDYTTVDPQAMEHSEGWPAARTNHYLFDLNRDRCIVSQDETRARLAAVLEWRPQILVDFHEMGTDSSYFFPPPSPPISPYVGQPAKKWWQLFGDAISAEFDRRQWSYWTAEVFDAFYPGYGGSWLTYSGGVAMTFEQATASGLAQRRTDDSVVSLRDGAERHFEAGWATLKLVAAKRDEVLADVAAHFADIPRRAAAESIKYWVLAPRPRPDATLRLVDALLRQGIEVKQAAKVLDIDGATPLTGGEKGRVTVPAGSFAVAANQASHDLVRSLLAPDVALDEAFLADERERAGRRERSFIYDVTAWNLALSFGIDSWSVDGDMPGEFVPVSEASKPVGSFDTRPEITAWLVSSHTGEAARILPALARSGIAARVTTFALQNAGRSFPEGSVVVLRERNADDVSARLQKAAQEAAVTVAGATTLRDSSGFDLGSNRVRPWVAPRVAVLGDEPTSEYSFGAVRHYFERVLALDYASLRSTAVARSDLRHYDVLVVPDGGNYGQFLGDDGVKRVQGWVEAGGTLILVKGGREFLTRGEKPWLRARAPEVKNLPAVRGALVRLEVKARHWLGHGLPENLCGLLRSDRPLEPYAEDSGENVVTMAAADRLRISGLMDDAQRAAFSGKAWLGTERHGAGQVIVFAEDVLVRANMVGLWPLFGNAVLLGPTFVK